MVVFFLKINYRIGLSITIITLSIIFNGQKAPKGSIICRRPITLWEKGSATWPASGASIDE